MRTALLGCAVVASAATTAAHASCAALTQAEARAGAAVVFEGVAQPGQTLPGSEDLASPYRFRVDRYLKGSGGGEVTVASGDRYDGVFHHSPRVESAPGGAVAGFSTTDLRVRAGQRWVIYANPEPEGFLSSSACSGSHLVGEPGPFIDATAPPTAPASAPSGVSPQSSWPAWALGGAVGVAAVIGLGWVIARKLLPAA